MFALPKLSAYRPSYFARVLQKEADGWFFAKLLCEVAPDRYRALRDHSGDACYRALLIYCEQHFPIFEADPYMAEEEGISELAWARMFGIPIDAAGINGEEFYDGDLEPDIAVALRMITVSQDTRRGDYGLDLDFSQEAVAKSLRGRGRALYSAELLTIVERGLWSGFRYPPRGRQWLEPWNGLGDLYDWLTSQTGSMILDYSNQDVQEMGDYPRWTAGEIRGWSDDWRRHRPIWDRIQALLRHLRQRDKAANLKTFALALAGDEPTRQAISRAKPGKRGTLAYIFGKEKKR